MHKTGFVAILRHGAYHQRADTPSARQPYALTQEGLDQARDGAERLHHMVQDNGLSIAPVIYSSKQLRAWQTADAILAQLRDLGHQIETVEETSALAERGLGSAANLTISEIEAILKTDPRFAAAPSGWKSNSDYRLPLEGAESLMDAGKRVATHLRQTVKSGIVTVQVGHGASFRHACHHLGMLERKEILKLSMFHAQPLLLCHESSDKWRHLDGDWKVRAPKEDPID